MEQYPTISHVWLENDKVKGKTEIKLLDLDWLEVWTPDFSSNDDEMFLIEGPKFKAKPLEICEKLQQTVPRKWSLYDITAEPMYTPESLTRENLEI